LVRKRIPYLRNLKKNNTPEHRRFPINVNVAFMLYQKEIIPSQTLNEEKCSKTGFGGISEAPYPQKNSGFSIGANGPKYPQDFSR
jgi:hypothetical protein